MLQNLGSADLLRRGKVPRLLFYPQSWRLLRTAVGRGKEPPRVGTAASSPPRLLAHPSSSLGRQARLGLLIKKAPE